MTLQVLFWLLLGAWALAVAIGLTKLAFDVLAADARGARLAARSVLPAVRTCIQCGVIFSTVVVLAMIFDTIDKIWDLSFKPFSYDLTAYSGLVKRVVLGVVCWICFVMVVKLLDRLLDWLFPNGPDQPNADGGKQQRQGVANGT